VDADRVRLTLEPGRLTRRLLVLCLGVEGLLLLLDLLVTRAGLTTLPSLRQLCDLEREDGLGNWVASVQTLMVGLTAWLVRARLPRMDASARRRTGWTVLAVFFTYLALDDGAAIHERVGSAVVDWLNALDRPPPAWLPTLLEALPAYAWHVLFGPVFGALGLYAVLFLWRELGPGRAPALAGITCLVLAIVLDVLDGLDLIGSGLHEVRVFEELVEMLGFTLLWTTFLGHLLRLTPHLSIAVKPEG
jgi:hypothetical protein